MGFNALHTRLGRFRCEMLEMSRTCLQKATFQTPSFRWEEGLTFRFFELIPLQSCKIPCRVSLLETYHCSLHLGILRAIALAKLTATTTQSWEKKKKYFGRRLCFCMYIHTKRGCYYLVQVLAFTELILVQDMS